MGVTLNEARHVLMALFINNFTRTRMFSCQHQHQEILCNDKYLGCRNYSTLAIYFTAKIIAKEYLKYLILKLKIFQRHDISPYHHQHQQTLQNLVDPMNNDVTVLQSDYQRIKKHTPTYQADFAGIFPNLLTNTISNTFDSDEEETISSGTLIGMLQRHC